MKFLILSFFVISSSALAQTVVVTDPGAYTYLNGLDKKLQEQLEFSQKVYDSNLAINSSLSGNKKSAYGINNNLISYEEYFQIKASALAEAKISQAAEKPDQISRQIDVTFPYFKVSISSSDSKESADITKKTYRAVSAKTTLVFAEMILNTSKNRVNQIRSLANDIDSTSTTKEAIDLNNRLLLEIITEVRNNNILLANYIKSQTSNSYEGPITTSYLANPDNSREVDDLFSGRSSLGSSLMRPSEGGKFSKGRAR